MINTMNVCEDNYIKQTESNINTKVARTFSFAGLRLYRNIKSYMHKIMNIKAALCRERHRTNEKKVIRIEIEYVQNVLYIYLKTVFHTLV